MDASPSFPFTVDEKGSKGEGLTTIPRKAFRGAVTNADAYQATRAALRVEGEILRIGNRFVPVGKYREIAFVAAGNASVSQTLAAVHGLGARLTQGFVAGPDPVPPEIPFRGVRVPRGYPGSREGVEAGRLMLELAGGLGPNDLLLALVSAGAIASFAAPDPNRTPAEPGPWISAMRSSGASSREISLAQALLYGGGVDGGLAEAAGKAEVQSIVVDRGDGGDLIGGSPTRRLLPAQRALGIAVLDRTTGLTATGSPRTALAPRPIPPPLPASVGRPVVVAGPDDALRGAADAVGEKRYLPRLAQRSYEGGPEAVARQFSGRLDEILRDEAAALKSRNRDGLVAFATATFDVPEGFDERPAIRRFLSEARPKMRHRGALVGAFATSGGSDPADPAGGFVEANLGGAGEVLKLRGVTMQPGITDVGCLLVAVVPAPRE
jgi:hypothetical protein